MDCPQGEKWPLKRGGHCREVAVVKKLKQDSVYGLSAKKKNGRCKEVKTRFSVWTVSAKKKKNHCREVAVGGHCVEVVVSGGSTVF